MPPVDPLGPTTGPWTQLKGRYCPRCGALGTFRARKALRATGEVIEWECTRCGSHGVTP